ncbi:GntR family transcriptional regulator [Proteiniborus ethanoligenes]|uniref:GntR family transcriptional regulator n=1 Tax=Proteiniborus ethanoligenes TaxID=415015 RepID=A0A1H3P849_9FIRM|nr:GntR family transcriptional regulator [Proteiniborus ethanoligenes]TAH63188.1 MAG: GntR family transcriptional regulator [Gottschalkiaceae bacterium]SDY96559.1 GntR family transcriptional regulator [Proteiniborus ethanoligenes]
MFITLSNTNPDPLYKQVKDQIVHAIITGDLKEDELLPSIRAMANELNISVITIKRAYADLENEGYIITRPGLGSFVNTVNKESLKSGKIIELREKLRDIVNEACKYNIKTDDIIRIINEIKEER